jgi:GTP cyclohydrolase I
VAIREVPFHSLCEHHLVPFFGVAEIVYLPNAHIAGFSSIARVLHHFARRPQLQERLAAQVADALIGALTPAALLVRLRARQLCVEMRGFGTGVECTSTAARGLCREPVHARHAIELLNAGS